MGPCSSIRRLPMCMQGCDGPAPDGGGGACSPTYWFNLGGCICFSRWMCMKQKVYFTNAAIDVCGLTRNIALPWHPSGRRRRPPRRHRHCCASTSNCLEPPPLLPATPTIDFDELCAVLEPQLHGCTCCSCHQPLVRFWLFADRVADRSPAKSGLQLVADRVADRSQAKSGLQLVAD